MKFERVIPWWVYALFAATCVRIVIDFHHDPGQTAVAVAISVSLTALIYLWMWKRR